MPIGYLKGNLNSKKYYNGLEETSSDGMIRKEVMAIAKKLIKEDRDLLRKLAEEHKYLKKE